MSDVLTADGQFEQASNTYGKACDTQENLDKKTRISLMKNACEQAENALEIFKKDKDTQKIESCKSFIAEVKKMIKLLK
jgi:nitrogen regulatory protein PII